jgi:hypothetical protein
MRASLKRLLRKIGEINHHYREPRIVMSRRVRAALLFLRFYLMFLVCLMVYKFILLLN